MERDFFDKIHRINYLVSEIDALYHQASLKIGLSDSESIVLYTIYDNGESCLLSDIYKQSGISKQTVNSALRKLEEESILYLEQHCGRSKKVTLTDEGKVYVGETIAKIFEAENAAFASWTEKEVDTHIRLTEKYVESFREQVNKL